jgi:cephalosporin-C deacetylase-like acetyl esterase
VLNALIQQPEVDPKRISIIGHSEGTVIAPRVAIDNLTKVKKYSTYWHNSSESPGFSVLSSGFLTLRVRYTSIG